MSEISDQIQTLVPEYVRNLQIYQSGKPIEELTRERGLTKISKLASNENPLGPSPFAIQKMTNALWDVHRYPDMNAYALKSSLARLYKLKKENIILSVGRFTKAINTKKQEFLIDIFKRICDLEFFEWRLVLIGSV
ncbi:MAG: hypothetical protein Q7U04_11325, partial [Bacteriovorax sp.]|nr:hypothetical protein [Bacteriovorax sp.]